MSSPREGLVEAIKAAARDCPEKAKEILKALAGNGKPRGSS